MNADPEKLDEFLKPISKSMFLRFVCTIGVILGVIAIYQIGKPLYTSGALFKSWKWQMVLVVISLVSAGNIILLFRSFSGKFREKLDTFECGYCKNTLFKILLLILSVVGLVGLAWLITSPYGNNLQAWGVKAFLLWVASIGFGLLLSGVFSKLPWLMLFAISPVLVGAVYFLSSFIPNISTYPFSLGWSEGSRYYYASLLFSKQIYGTSLPLSVWHPSRYILQGLAFLIPGLSLQAHRIWQVMLWIITLSVTGFGMVYHLKKRTPGLGLLIVIWTALYLYQAPVYYHLLVCLILILFGYDRQNHRRTYIFMVVASIWAGMSRINWIPLPAGLVIILYLLDNPIQKGVSCIKYFRLPLLFGIVGTAVGFGSNALYAMLSGNELAQFGSSFTSDLLWYRLFPNPTFPEGILPGILYVSVPILLLISVKFIQFRQEWNPLRPILLALITLVFFLGGLVVSIKIGGGSNLHNMDAFLVIILILGARLFFNQVEPMPDGKLPVKRGNIFILALILLVPVWMVIRTGAPFNLPDLEIADRNLNDLRQRISSVIDADGEVLFIGQRHLITFSKIEQIPLIPDYENITLMEMAMAGNNTYLTNFYSDISSKKYALIISPPNPTVMKGKQKSFGEENDIYLQRVTIPLMEYYKIEKSYKKDGFELLIPR